MFQISSHIKAIFFDLNGTLLRNQTAHREAFRQMFGEYKIILNPEEYEAKVANHLNKEIWTNLLGPLVSEVEIAALSAVKERTYAKLMPKMSTTVPGVHALLKFLSEKNIPAFFVTNAPDEVVTVDLEWLCLERAFKEVINGRYFQHGKPSPEPYLVALSHAQIKASEATVFEDAPQGVRAGVAAEIYTIGVVGEYTEEDLLQAGAKSCVTDFTEVSRS